MAAVQRRRIRQAREALRRRDRVVADPRLLQRSRHVLDLLDLLDVVTK